MIRIAFIFFISLALLVLFLFLYKDKPKIYYSALGLIVLLLALGSGWVLLQEKQYDGLIPTELISIEQETVEITGYKRFVKARISNLSGEYKLTSVTIRLDLTQCSDAQEPECLVIDSSEVIIPAHIDPESQLDINYAVHFDPATHDPAYSMKIEVIDSKAIK